MERFRAKGIGLTSIILMKNLLLQRWRGDFDLDSQLTQKWTVKSGEMAQQ